MFINNIFKKLKSDFIAQVFRADTKAKSLKVGDNKHTDTKSKEHQCPEISIIIKLTTQRILHKMKHHI